MIDADLDARLSRIEALLGQLLDPDLAKLQEIVPRIARVVGPSTFLLADLVDDVDFSGMPIKTVGLLFERNKGRVVGGFKIEPGRRTANGRQWILVSLPLHGAGGTIGAVD